MTSEISSPDVVPKVTPINKAEAGVDFSGAVLLDPDTIYSLDVVG